MPADTHVAGYPAHAVDTFTWDVNEWGTRTVQWTAQCGYSGTMTGGRFTLAGSARRMELCSECFPGRDHNACKMNRPKDLTVS